MDGYGLFDSIHDQLVNMIALGRINMHLECGNYACRHMSFSHWNHGKRACAFHCPCYAFVGPQASQYNPGLAVNDPNRSR
jgi:hypothetical protein